MSAKDEMGKGKGLRSMVSCRGRKKASQPLFYGSE